MKSMRMKGNDIKPPKKTVSDRLNHISEHGERLSSSMHNGIEVMDAFLTLINLLKK